MVDQRVDVIVHELLSLRVVIRSELLWRLCQRRGCDTACHHDRRYRRATLTKRHHSYSLRLQIRLWGLTELILPSFRAIEALCRQWMDEFTTCWVARVTDHPHLAPSKESAVRPPSTRGYRWQQDPCGGLICESALRRSWRDGGAYSRSSRGLR